MDVVPEILAPAGNREAFLAALAAGADAVYCGLKHFSARMEADNFSMDELARLATLAREREVRVYTTFNTLIKPDEVSKAGRLVEKLCRYVNPDALILQDPGMVRIARSAGFEGELHLSTLANVSHADGLTALKEDWGVCRVVIPRELSIDEIKLFAETCPPGLDLEVFIQGALCYAVSGRCYWSSFLGGKSGLRGRCVQPCRRLYTHEGQANRYFSSLDFSLDVLAKVMKTVPQVRTWKIEGRKKGPHYVYYTVTAYRKLRDQGQVAQEKKAALGLLSQALGRPTTHYNLLSQRPQEPIQVDADTGSGMFIGRIQGGKGKLSVHPRVPLYAGDRIRMGYEGGGGHAVMKIRRSMPRQGKYQLPMEKARGLQKGDPVFLIDRREPALVKAIDALEAAFDAIPAVSVAPAAGRGYPLAKASRKGGKNRSRNMLVRWRLDGGPTRKGFVTGAWISEQTLTLSGHRMRDIWWWLPPVIWPEESRNYRALIDRAFHKGSRKFVLNAPWQLSLFPDVPGAADLDCWAGPFCNIANGAAIDLLADTGFSGVMISPELTGADILALPEQSRLPLGLVVSGMWPMAISRTVSGALRTEAPFTSPRGETGFVRSHGSNYWIYPNWELDLTKHGDALQKAGYQWQIRLTDPIPKGVERKQRPGQWNWDLRLL